MLAIKVFIFLDRLNHAGSLLATDLIEYRMHYLNFKLP